jgi:hypothetical protein
MSDGNGNKNEVLRGSIQVMMGKPLLFMQQYSHITLRSYQVDVALAILNSIRLKIGLTFCVLFPRQSGKNELQAQLECYLLACLASKDTDIVKFSPTWKPQTLNAMRRLERTLQGNLLLQDLWTKRQGYIYQVGKAKVVFFSGGQRASIVGATAGTLLEVDEAQDISIAKYDKDIAPMAASTNATRVLWGTAWTDRTLLARERRLCEEEQKKDGIQRVFRVNGDEVGKEVKAYQLYVENQVRRLGRNHPFVKTQYFSEEIDGVGGMFTEERMMMMFGKHQPRRQPDRERVYAMTIDVAGSDETRQEEIASSIQEDEIGREHDLTALTVFELDLSTLEDPLIGAPRFNVVYRRVWQNVKMSEQYVYISAQIDIWHPYRVVVDATGIGQGLESFLAKKYGSVILPFVFNLKSKSELAWKWLSMIDSGRYKEYEYEGGDEDELRSLQIQFRRQLRYCRMTIRLGPAKLCQWGVDEDVKEDGEAIHDDLLISASLITVLENESWGTTISTIVAPRSLEEGLKF